MKYPTMSGALNGKSSRTRPRSPSPEAHDRFVKPRFDSYNMTGGNLTSGSFTTALPNRSVSREPESVRIKQEQDSTDSHKRGPPEVEYGKSETYMSLSHLILDESSHELYPEHVKAVVDKMFDEKMSQLLKSKSTAVMTSVKDHGKASGEKKKAVLLILTQALLEKILEDVEDVMMAADQQDTEVALAVKQLLKKISTSASSKGGSAAYANGVTSMDQARINEPKPTAKSIQTDHNPISKVSTDVRQPMFGVSPFALQPINAYPQTTPTKPAAMTSFASTPANGAGSELLPLQIERYGGGTQGKYTFRLQEEGNSTKGKVRVPEKDIKGSVINIVKNSPYPVSKWYMEKTPQGEWLLHFAMEVGGNWFVDRILKVNGRKFHLVPFVDKRPQVFICRSVPREVDFDLLLMSIVAARPGRGTYVAAAPRVPVVQQGNSFMVVIADEPTDVQAFVFTTSEGPLNGTKQIRFEATFGSRGCLLCGQQHVVSKCPMVWPMRLSSGKPLVGLLQTAPQVV